MAARCSCIIVNYRAAAHTKQLKEWLAVDPRLEVIVIDAEAEQLGYGAAANRGLAQAHGQFVAILNPDLFLAPAGVQLLCDELEFRPDVGMVGPVLFSGNGQRQITCSQVPNAWQSVLLFSALRRLPGVSWLQRWYRLGNFDHRTSRAVPAINGSCMIFRRAELQELGAFDESLFLYFEEFDLALRFAAQGKTAEFSSAVAVLHIGQVSTKRQPKVNAMFQASRRTWLRKHYGWQGRVAAWCLERMELWRRAK